jgi:hypothetical protein
MAASRLFVCITAGRIGGALHVSPREANAPGAGIGDTVATVIRVDRIYMFI